MKTISKMKTRLALFSIAGSLLLSSFAAAAVPSHLNEDYVLIMSVPFEAPDEITISYTSGGGEAKERTVNLSEKIGISITGLDLETQDIPFDLFQTGEGFALDLGTHPENSLSPVLGLASDLTTLGVEPESTIQFSSTIPGSKMAVFPVADKENAEVSIEGETPVPFIQEGVLRIEFAKQAEAPAEEPKQENPGEGPQAGSTGGCSLASGSVAGSTAWLMLLPIAFAAAFRRKLAS